MPRRKRDLEPSQWLERIDRALAKREEYACASDWDQWDKYFKGQYPTESNKPGEYANSHRAIVVNYLHANERILVPSIYMADPYFTVLAPENSKVAHALVVESQLNRLLPGMGFQFQMRRAVRDASRYGTGVLKCGYDREFSADPDQMGITEEDEYGEDQVITSEISPTREDKNGQQIEYDEEIRPGRPWVKRVNPRDFVAPECDDITDAVWVAFRFVRPRQDIVYDDAFENTSELKSNVDLNAQSDESLPETDLVECWEVHDKKTGRMYVVAPDHEKYLRNKRDALLAGGTLPVSLIVFNEQPNSFWGVSDVQIALAQQLELNETREQARMHRRLSNVLGFYQQGAIDETAINKIYSDDPNPMIPVKGDPSKVVTLINRPIPQDLDMWGERIKSDMREQTGLGMNQRGQTGNKSHHPSATEVAIADQYAQTPISERRVVATHAAQRCVRKVLNLLFEFWTDGRVGQVAGPDGAQAWVQYNMRELRAEYDFRVVPESTATGTSSIRKQEIFEFLQSAGQAGLLEQVFQRNPNAAVELTRAMLQQMHSLPADRILPPEQMNGGQPMTMQQFGEQVANRGTQGQGGSNANVPGAVPDMPQGAGVFHANKPPA